MVLLWGTLLFVLGAIAWFVLPWRMAGSKSEAESRAHGALASVHEELAAYQASEGRFPASLELLGDRARSAAQKAQSVHYTLQCMPGKPDSDGRVKSYTLIARAGKYGYLNFSTDETQASYMPRVRIVPPQLKTLLCSARGSAWRGALAGPPWLHKPGCSERVDVC